MSSETESGICIAVHHTQATVLALRDIVEKKFPLEVQSYCAWSTDAYRGLILEAQSQLSQEDFTRKICGEVLGSLTAQLDGDSFLIQSNLYLRAARPFVAQTSESVDWHRETFYGFNMVKALNIWTPILRNK
jgi:hypothetical protein